MEIVKPEIKKRIRDRKAEYNARKEYYKTYYEATKEHMKEYKLKNVERIKENRKVETLCSCGRYIEQQSRRKHLTSKYHLSHQQINAATERQ